MEQLREQLRVAVLGPGGVGGLIAGLLARAGDRVVCVAGVDTAAILQRDGITVRSGQFGTFTSKVSAVATLSTPVNVCLITVKATNLDEALERVPPPQLGDALVVPLLNGIDHVAKLRQRYPVDHVVPATIRVETTRVAPGVVEHTSPFTAIQLSRGRSHEHATVEHFAEHLRRAGADVGLRDDETTMLWDKLAFLAPLALLTTHKSASAGTVRTQHRAELLSVIHEVCMVATRDGASVHESAVIDLFDGLPETMQSSMQRDAAAGREIELEAIGGAILRAAERHGVAVPTTRRLVDDLRDREPLNRQIR
jgi:2-dehydropantoate 2-reductase